MLVLALVACAVAASGCMNQDPFGCAERVVLGHYRMEQWEDGTYYLVGDGLEPADPLVRIGWQGHRIVAEELGRSGRYVLVVDAAARTIRKSSVGGADAAVPLADPDAAWKSLPRPVVCAGT